MQGIQQPHVNSEFDVIVVGASLAGCTAARLYALQGLRVALIEQQREPVAFKHLCTHFIQASATPTLKRLGLDRLIEEAGGLRNSVDIWTRYGWTGDVPPLDADGQPVYGYSIRRLRLDPILRELVALTPGVTLLAGCSVRGLIRDAEAITGVEIGGQHSGALRARLGLLPMDSQPSAAELAAQGVDLSRLERRSDEADRYVATFLKCVYLRDRVGQTFDGLVTTVTEFGCFVQLLALGVDGLLALASLRDDDYQMARDGGQWIGQRSKRRLAPGVRLRVIVAAVRPVEGMIDLELATD